jgi:hypothetical protein
MGSDVAVLGDSFLAQNGQLVTELEALAQSSGTLEAGDGYRDYSSTVITAFGDTSDLASQYLAASAEGVPRVVIMDVGGPDALATCPDPPTEACPALANAAAGASDLWAQMATDGVETVVNFFYPDPEDASMAAKFDVLRPMIQEGCAASPLDCHFLDLRSSFDGQTGYLMPGGLLPTAAGSTEAAAAIWSLMQARCVAQ